MEQVPVARDVRSADAVHIGVVSLWEFIFKQHLGLLEGPGELTEHVRDLAFPNFPSPTGPRHRLVLVTRNDWIPLYDVPVMRV
ncbi:hypothetical protein AMK28_14645 [Streptomyces sp. CB02115]|nr:hypothetical protein AMK28_14645 [Streptomyces sp. CB02115]